jgi:DNA-entry nuclease
MKRNVKAFFLILLLCMATLIGCNSPGAAASNSSYTVGQSEANIQTEYTAQSSIGLQGANQVKDIPDYSGDPYYVINDNQPSFAEGDYTTSSFESYSNLDELGRCGVAFANIGMDLMPTEERGSIGQVKPSGWQTVKYDNVDGKYLYNRCHLIGYQLTGENANKQNLITGTRYMNVVGMLPFENMVADYIKETNNHVLYRVTPVFNGDDLVVRGVQMEAVSVEDNSEGICFNVFVYNVQPGIIIDYATGKSSLGTGYGISTEQVSESSVDQPAVEIRGNSNSKTYHCPGQAAYDEMVDSKYLKIFRSEQEAVEAGYRKAKR